MFSTNRPATLVEYASVWGGERLESHVRMVDVKIDAFAQYPIAAYIEFKKPRERRSHTFVVVPNNIRYVTIEQNGQVVYDTRQDVPCDMQAWESAVARQRATAQAHAVRTAAGVNTRTAAYLDNAEASA